MAFLGLAVGKEEQYGLKMEVPQKLLDYLNQARVPLPSISSPDDPLHLDSLAIIRLMAFLDTDLGISIEDDELHADNFATLGAIARLLESKSLADKSADTSGFEKPER